MTRPRISVFIGMSLDGYIATENNSVDWLVAASSEDEDYGFNTFLSDIDIVAMGRSTYDFIKNEPELPYGTRPIHVFTSQSLNDYNNFHFFAKSPHEAVNHWESLGYQHVYVDGGLLVSQFLEADLVDDLTLTVAPLLLGSGKSLFHPRSHSTQLQLVSSQSFKSGMTQLKYVRA